MKLIASLLKNIISIINNMETKQIIALIILLGLLSSFILFDRIDQRLEETKRKCIDNQTEICNKLFN
jgi:hypothetical protein